MDKDLTHSVTITAEHLLQELTRQDTDSVVYSLRNAQIVGRLDLRNCTVHVAIDIQDCDFLDEVDLRYCEFSQAVNFSRCLFKGDFNSGTIPETHTIYRKDLICNNVIFRGAVRLYGCRVEGSAYFYRSTFQNTQKPVDLSLSHFGKTLEFEEAVFRGPFNLNGIQCSDTGVFYKAAFEGGAYADFGFASFGGNLECDNTIFERSVNFGSIKVGGHGFFNSVRFKSEKEVNLGGASFGRNLEFDHAVFRGRANFNALQCGGAGLFRGVEFEGGKEANFDYASFEYGLDWSSSSSRRTIFGGPANFRYLKSSFLAGRDAVFRGPTSFNSLECGTSAFLESAVFEERADFGHASFGMNVVCNAASFQGPTDLDSLECVLSGFFHEVTFEKRVDFNHASFGKNLSCDRATFHGPATFRSLRCVDSGFFRGTKFVGDVDFAYASFGGNLECTGVHTAFQKHANFNRIKCEGSGRFDEASFFCVDRATNFVLAHFGINLSFKGTRFARPVDFWLAHVERALILTAANFQQKVVLSGATVGQLEIRGDTSPFTEDQLILRGYSFRSFVGEVSIAEKFVEAQDPAMFSKDPYTNLEKYYKDIGDDVQATRMYRKGRLDHRTNAIAAIGNTEWSKGEKLKDWFFKISTCYGVQTWRLLLPLILVFVLGTVLFWSDDALKPRTSISPVVLDGPVAQPLPDNKNNTIDVLRPKIIYRPGYSLDLLLPVVNLRFEDQVEPGGPLLKAYASLQIIIGWILIPLLLASLAGIVGRR